MTFARERLDRIIALALFAAVLVALVFATYVPLASWRSAQLDKLETLQIEEARLTAAIERLSFEEQQLAASSGPQLTWLSEAPGEAAARVQSVVTELAEQAGVRFRSVSPLRASSNEGLETVALRIEFEADLSQMTSLLKAIEYHQPALHVDRATLRRLNRPNTNSEQPQISAQLDLAAPILLRTPR